MIFFRPTRSYIKWLIDYAAGRLIIDIGCGECYLLKKLVRMGGFGLGVDPWVRTARIHEMLRLGVQVVPMEAEEFSLVAKRGGSLLVFCRPGHCGFVARTLRANAGNEVLYISKPENLDLDIPEGFHAERLATPRCRIEQTFRILGDQPCPPLSRPATLSQASNSGIIST
jgi:hypothetical protein